MAYDPVNPAHYAKIQGLALEPLIMEAPYFLGAAIKYVWRCKKKGGAEDIRKSPPVPRASPRGRTHRYARRSGSRRPVHPQNPAQPPRPASNRNRETA